ncbi:MAG TPA: NAD(P)-dependent oxidoreductase [Capillimicrobium sp.]|nr:NAD(P)-dependent oxidoreductase [Capillimicrobium sp.]
MIAAVTEKALDAARAAAPAGVEVRPLADGLGDAEVLVPAWDDALDGIEQAAALRLVQTLSAGTDWIEDRLPPGATLCNAQGARDASVAEWVVGALLGATTGLLVAARERRWSYAPPAELGSCTVVIVGHGSIGRAVAARLEPFGTRVVGVASRARDGLHGAEALPELLPQADAVVILAPLTAATRGMFDAALLRRMRDGALLVNAGRGAIVDTGALAAELEAGRLRAVLDVVDPEPLPAEHRLWQARGLLALTPHLAGDSADSERRAIAMAAEQLRRYAAGEPLANVVRAPTAARSRR